MLSVLVFFVAAVFHVLIPAATAQTSSKYRLVEQKMTYEAARSHCRSEYGTDLASIHSTADNDEAKNLCATGAESCWFGLTDLAQEHVFLWEDGTAFDYGTDVSGGVYPWHSNQPDDGQRDAPFDSEDCCELRAGFSYNWNDDPCSAQKYFICNLDATPAPTQQPTQQPTKQPTRQPTANPSQSPTTASPTAATSTTASPTTATPTTATPTTASPTTASPSTTSTTSMVTESAIASEYYVTIEMRSASCADISATVATAIDSSLPQVTVGEEECTDGAEDDHNEDAVVTVVLLVAVASNAQLDYDVIESALREAMVKEYGDDVVAVHVHEAQPDQVDSAQSAPSVPLVVIVASGASGGLVCGACVCALVCYMHRRRRSGVNVQQLDAVVELAGAEQKEEEEKKTSGVATITTVGATAGDTAGIDTLIVKVAREMPTAAEPPPVPLNAVQVQTPPPESSAVLQSPVPPAHVRSDTRASESGDREASLMYDPDLASDTTRTGQEERKQAPLDASQYATWTSDEVVRWIVALNYEAHKQYEPRLRAAFAADIVNGKAMSGVSEGYLRQCGVGGVHCRVILQNMYRVIRRHGAELSLELEEEEQAEDEEEDEGEGEVNTGTAQEPGNRADN